MAVAGGYWNIESPAFDTAEWGAIGDRLAFDMFMPADQQNPYWTGDVQAFLEVPGASVYNQPLGQQQLTSLPLGQWSRIEFAVPSNLETVLLGNYSGALFRIGINVASCTAPVLVDNIRFEGQLHWHQ